MLEAAAPVEAFQRSHDQLRVDLVDLVPAEAELLHVARADVLDKDVGVFEQIGQDLLAFRILHIQRDRLLVGVELQEVQRIGAVDIIHLVTGRVAALDLLELDDFCAQPSQHLGARRAGLHLGPVDDLDARKRGGVSSVSHMNSLNIDI